MSVYIEPLLETVVLEIRKDTQNGTKALVTSKLVMW